MGANVALRARRGGGTWARRLWIAGLAAGAGAALIGARRFEMAGPTHVVLAYNELGMHCMQEDFSEMMILPPFNTLRAQVIDRTHGSPEIVTEGVTVRYILPDNTRSADKCNFWTYDLALLGVDLPADVGLGGKGMAGTMSLSPERDWQAVGIPVTPIEDSGRENPYPLALVSVDQNGAVVAQTQAVVPVSWEMSCNICHDDPNVSTATDILMDHDRLHGTNLVNAKPVFCASCHADPAVGSPGQPGIPYLSTAMHGAHASRMASANLENECYACHPGFRTSCQRDIHSANNLSCNDCHVGGMTGLGDPGRTPWADVPSCGSCHTRAGFEFEEPGKLFRTSRGHGKLMCMTCHNSPHAITPTSTPADNLQAMAAQGHPGVINTCTVCHQTTPDDPFPHRLTE
ncbi:MAG: hypothetical protein AMXMBFR58_10820 [Phycisphaerae bacterium]